MAVFRRYVRISGLYKLIAGRYQDLADIQKIAMRKGATLDLAYIREWASWLADETGRAQIRDLLDQPLPSSPTLS